jgi:glutamate---cysteine ligase / carboxylate-amine ligase
VSNYPYPAFSGYGLELEYMIVDASTLNVLPIADRILASQGAADDMDVVREQAAWSNELALHVIELKTLGPSRDFAEAERIFRGEIRALSSLLEAEGARLMPTGAHPWMDPARETRLWPHQNDVIYQAFDRIFDCRGHGWSNLQSMHINFPFQTEDEFVRVHAACRFVLPLLPGLAASTPFLDGKKAAALDARLLTYEGNCRRVPEVTGEVVPEVIESAAAYEQLLARIYTALAPHDPSQILREEWVNARGAIARFERGAIEIRVLDTQECPEQDMAIAVLVTSLVKALASGEFLPESELVRFPSAPLVEQYRQTRTDASGAKLLQGAYRAAFGSSAGTVGSLWRDLVERLVPSTSPARARLDLIAREGTLAERLVRRAGPVPPHDALRLLYGEVCTCLLSGEAFCP